ncbi:MAG: superoxide dismutase [Ni] [Planctomycetota bacterium]
MKNGIVLVVAVALILTGLDGYVQAVEDDLPIKHVIVYKQPGRFCGWPANNGAWSWGNEILVCFDLHYFKEPEPDIDPTEHHWDKNKPAELVFARSLDGGESWVLEKTEAFGPSHKTKPALPSPGDINFAHPDFAMRLRWHRFHVSYDRGKSWSGPYQLPSFGIKLGARTDYIVDGKDSCTLFLSSANGPLCVRTTDGGKTFELLSNVRSRSEARAIMPSSVRISDRQLVSAVRQLRGEPYVSWIDLYESADNGRTWKFLSKVADADNRYWNGNPPSMVRLGDGRICITYGYRAVPYGIRAKTSSDNGKTWGPEIILRQDGRNWDLGYSRTVQRPDGKLVTVYYYSTDENPQQRIIATIWDPDTITTTSVDRKAMEQIDEHIDAIEDAIKQIERLSRGKVESVNSIVRWHQIKELHCDQLRKIVAYHFLSQRTGLAEQPESEAQERYAKQVFLLQKILTANMQAKQKTDPSSVRDLRSLLRKFQAAYFSDPDAEGMDIQAAPDQRID